MTPSDEQMELARAERSWLELHDPVARVRTCLDRSPVTVDPAAATHAVEAGLDTLLTPDAGGTHADLAVLSEAHGRAASSLPIADVALAQWLLDAARTQSGGDVGLEGALVGVVIEHTGAGMSAPLPMAADMAAVVLMRSDQWGDYVDLVVAPDLHPMSTLDLTRSWARVRLPAESARELRLPRGTAAFVVDALALHRAWDALGSAARLLEATVTYAGQRQQFDAVIGSFQAVKHHCADMAVAVEASRAVLWSASASLDPAGDAGARRTSVAAAVAFAKQAACDVAGTALQVHGGIGFTWEHDLHLFMRRIKVDRAMNGTVEVHRAALVDA